MSADGVLQADARASADRLAAAGLLRPRGDAPPRRPIGLQDGSSRDCGFVTPATLQELSEDGGSAWAWIEAQVVFANPQSLPRMLSLAAVDESLCVTDDTLLRRIPIVPGEDDFDRLRDEQNRAWALDSVACGVAKARDGNHEAAIRFYDKALALHPQCVEGLVARGAANANMDKLEMAVKDLEAAIALDAGHANAQKYLDITLKKLQEKTAASAAESASAAILSGLSSAALAKLKQEAKEWRKEKKSKSKHRRGRSSSPSGHRRRHRSSSSSSSSSSDSSRERRRRRDKKKHKRRDKSRDKSRERSRERNRDKIRDKSRERSRERRREQSRERSRERG